MTRVYMPAFYLGVQEEMEKFARCWEGYEPVPGKKPYAEDSCQPKGTKKKKEEKKAFDVSSMPVNENILPSISNQARWKYVRTKDGIKLSDGNLVYSFGVPSEYPREDTKVPRLEDDNILNFENDALSKGTAQIHRSSPDNIYMTLADGAHNPTFMLQHEEGKNWRYSPSKKFLAKLKTIEEKTKNNLPRANNDIVSHTDSTLIDPIALFDGARDELSKKAFMGMGADLDSEGLANLIKSIGGGVSNFAQASMDHPATTMAGGVALMSGVNALRNKIHPDLKIKSMVDPKERTRQALYPIAAGAIPMIVGGALKAYQSHG